MRNTTCIICNKNFEAREGQLFCSNRCKMINYRRKQNIKSAPTGEHEASNKQTSVPEDFNFNFKQSELDGFIKWCKENNKQNPIEESYDFMLSDYCFFRKDLTGEINFNQLYDIMERKIGTDGFIEASNKFCDAFRQNMRGDVINFLPEETEPK